MKIIKPTIFIIILSFTVYGCSKEEDPTPVVEEIVDLSKGLSGQFDLNGESNNYTIVGDVPLTVDRHGNDNSAMLFNGTTGYVEVGDIASVKITDEISISVWVNANGNQTEWDTIISKWKTTSDEDGVGSGYYLGLNPEGLTLRGNASSQIIDSNNSFPINQWVHVVFTYDEITLKLYINGSITKEVESIGDLLDNDVPLRIGQLSEWTGNNGFNGAIDDIYIYDRVINTEEVSELYNQ